MSSDRVPALKRRQILAATAGLVGLAGCGGGSSDGGDGDSGSDGDDGGSTSDGENGGNGLYEGDDFTCASVGEASFAQYDAAGTGLLCDFEYPDVFDGPDESGSPVTRVQFQRRFGGDESYTEDTLLLTVTQLDPGVDRSNVPTEDEAVSEVEFGDRTAYIGPTLGITGEPNRGNFTAYLPREIDGTVRYFSVQFRLSIDIQVTEGNRDAPEDCATTIDETCRTMAESVTPNAETRFDETREE